MDEKNADPWVVAYSLAYSSIIVTQESFDPNVKKRIKIPNLCNELKIKYINTFELLNQLGFKF